MIRTTDELPDALSDAALRARLTAQPIALFLDYDGTLTPIVARPELAILAPETRDELLRLAGRCFVAVISGRDLDDVRAMVLGPGGEAAAGARLWFAGSHGFDLLAPDGTRTDVVAAQEHRGALDAAADELDGALATIPGAWVERKRFAIAAHFRQVDDARVADVEAAVDAVGRAHAGLRKTGGKRIFELRPDVEWDKGRALWAVFDRAGLARDRVLPVFIGDDVTDEDAFAALGDDGIGIVVADDDRPTAATARLETPDAVRTFLARTADDLDGRGR